MMAGPMMPGPMMPGPMMPGPMMPGQMMTGPMPAGPMFGGPTVGPPMVGDPNSPPPMMPMMNAAPVFQNVYQNPSGYGPMGVNPPSMPQTMLVGLNVPPPPAVPPGNSEIGPPPPGAGTSAPPTGSAAAGPSGSSPTMPTMIMGGGFGPGNLNGGDGGPMYDGNGISDAPNGYPGMADGYGEGSVPGISPVAPNWYFRGDAVWLMRDRPNDRNLTIDTSSGDNKFVLSTNDVSFDMVSGMRLTFGYHVSDSTAIEAGFYGGNQWDASASTHVVQNGTIPGPLFPYYGLNSVVSGSNQQVAWDNSSFNSAEIGVRHWISSTTSFLFGFRYMNFYDKFGLTALNVESGEPNSSAGSYQAAVANNLFGGQIGVEYTHPLYCDWLFVSLEGKAAPS